MGYSRNSAVETTFIVNEEGKRIRVPVIPADIDERLGSAHGKMDYTLTNDRMFRGIVSYSRFVRQELVRILMGYEAAREVFVEVLNPVSFGQGPGQKETEEDILLLVNDSVQMNIELQNTMLSTNKPRFLLYLCRNFDTVRKSEGYESLRASIQIGIMNYKLEEKRPEFYAKYRFLNVKTGEPWFDDDDFFGMNVLDLTNLELAEKEDQKSGRLLLARLFRAETWEEIRELAEESPFAKEVAEYMYIANADVKERHAMNARRRYLEDQVTMENALKQTEEKLAEARQQTEASERARKAAEERAEKLQEELDRLKAQNQ